MLIDVVDDLSRNEVSDTHVFLQEKTDLSARDLETVNILDGVAQSEYLERTSFIMG